MKVETAPKHNISKCSFRKCRYPSKTVAVATSLEQGAVSGAIEENNAIFIVQTISSTPAPTTMPLAIQRNQVSSYVTRQLQRVDVIGEALEKSSDIKDNRADVLYSSKCMQKKTIPKI